jgi:hypothetical protein
MAVSEAPCPNFPLVLEATKLGVQALRAGIHATQVGHEPRVAVDERASGAALPLGCLVQRAELV